MNLQLRWDLFLARQAEASVRSEIRHVEVAHGGHPTGGNNPKQNEWSPTVADSKHSAVVALREAPVSMNLADTHNPETAQHYLDQSKQYLRELAHENSRSRRQPLPRGLAVPRGTAGADRRGSGDHSGPESPLPVEMEKRAKELVFPEFAHAAAVYETLDGLLQCARRTSHSPGRTVAGHGGSDPSARTTTATV